MQLKAIKISFLAMTTAFLLFRFTGNNKTSKRLDFQLMCIDGTDCEDLVGDESMDIDSDENGAGGKDSIYEEDDQSDQ